MHSRGSEANGWRGLMLCRPAAYPLNPQHILMISTDAQECTEVAKLVRAWQSLGENTGQIAAP